MTNTQLLLLATNNIKHKTALSHAQESYIYQFYHTHIAKQSVSLKGFLADFIQQTSQALENVNDIKLHRQAIYEEVEKYLLAAEKRYIQRQHLLQKN